jgi:hypothetical protein
MSKTLNMPERPSLLIPAVDEVPRISDAERAALRVSLEKASADIASGDFDVVTPQSLRSEFDAIYFDGTSDADIDAGLAKHSAHHS